MNPSLSATATYTAEEFANGSESWSRVSEELQVGLILLNDHGEILSINRSALEIFDLNRNEINLAPESKSATGFVSSLDAEEQEYWQNQIMIVLGTGESISCPRYFHHTGYAQKIISYKINRISRPELEQPLVAIFASDVTEQVTREKYVILSEKLVARGEMAATIASNLDKHLEKMAENANLIKAATTDGKPRGAELNASAILENIDSIREYIRQRLDFSEPETTYILYDIRLLLEDLLMTVTKKPRFRDVVFTVDLSPSIPLMEMDVGQVQYLFKNLLNNAADSLEEKRKTADDQFEKKISIEACWDSAREQLEVTISDNGVGISKKVLKKMYNLHFSTKKVSRGLGLYRCRQIVDQHDGEIEVDSVAGEGASFTVIFPRAGRRLGSSG